MERRGPVLFEFLAVSFFVFSGNLHQFGVIIAFLVFFVNVGLNEVVFAELD